MSQRTVSDAGEDGLLGAIFRTLGRDAASRPWVVLGPGDDAAAVRLRPGEVLVASQDDLVEGTHFELRWTDPRLLAGRLFAVGLSDLAAMGRVRPLGVLITSCLPSKLPLDWFLDFLRGVREAAARHRAPVLGGNLARSERVHLSISVLGAGRAGRLIRRTGAKPGDLLCGVGPLGEAAAGLELLRKGRSTGPLVRSFWSPEPLFGAGARLEGLATAMLDNSDGLLRSCRILAEESGVGLRLDLSRALASRALRRFCSERGLDLRRHQLVSAEDYGLVFTVPAGTRLWPDAYPLGRVVRKGRGDALAGRPFEHFL
ncbi:MAG: thiamine-phosphate kinase [Elusimicrobiota bacterium]